MSTREHSPKMPEGVSVEIVNETIVSEVVVGGRLYVVVPKEDSDDAKLTLGLEVTGQLVDVDHFRVWLKALLKSKQ